MSWINGLGLFDNLRIGMLDLKTDLEFASITRKASVSTPSASTTTADSDADKEPKAEAKTDGKKTEAKGEAKDKKKEQESPKSEEEKKAEAEHPQDDPPEPDPEPQPQPQASTTANTTGQTYANQDGKQRVDVNFDFAAMAGQQPMGGPAGAQVPPGVNPFTYYQQAQAAQPGMGRHKVDQPPQPPKPPKAEPDQARVDLGGIHVETNPPQPPRQWPPVVSGPLPNAEHVDPAAQPRKFDNSEITKKFAYMADIERVAATNGIQLEMHFRMAPDGHSSDGLITVVAYNDGNPKPNPLKGFTIDCGMIIDRRAKMFPVILPFGFEQYQAYPVLLRKEEKDKEKEKGKSKSKNVFNEELFDAWFKGGVQALRPEWGMYTQDYLALNQCVALITMPTNNMDGTKRKEMRDRLLAAMKVGVFKKAVEMAPGSRFRVESYDKKTGAFVLTNEGVPIGYDGPIQNGGKIAKIAFKADGNTDVIA